MKNNIRYIVLLFFLPMVFSCKKKYDSDYIGPQGKEGLNPQLIAEFKPNTDTANFTSASKLHFFFKATLDKPIDWKITITGLITGAEKTIIGTSAILDSLNTSWNGAQDSLYYFIEGEKCRIAFSDYYPLESNSFYDGLVNKGTITPPVSKISIFDTITIKKTKPLQENAFELFPFKGNSSNPNFRYLVGYDSELACDNEKNPDGSKMLKYQEASPDILNGIDPIATSKAYLPFAKNGSTIQRRGRTNTFTNAAGRPVVPIYLYENNYFIIKGTDINMDYFIGRIETVVSQNVPLRDCLASTTLTPDNVWFNVFIYGTGDGSKCNFTLKEEDNSTSDFNTYNKECIDGYPAPTKPYDGKGDDAFERPITLDFKGWKLFSFKYSDFDVIADGKNGNGDKTREPNSIIKIQLSLVAANPGGSAQVIFDYPVMTIGGPLKY